jgi:hypothetical protein
LPYRTKDNKITWTINDKTLIPINHGCSEKKISTSHWSSAKINYELIPHFIMTMTVLESPLKKLLNQTYT